MARILAQHGIEQFVHFWLSKFRNDAGIRRERRYMEKAIKQLQFFLNPPCCVDPDSTIEFRRLDNDLTRFIAAQIAQGAFDRRKWKKSLQRAIDALQARLDGCCDDSETILWEEDTLSDNSTYYDPILDLEIPDGVTFYFEASFDIFGQPAFGGTIDAYLSDENSLTTWTFTSVVGSGGGSSTGWTATAGEPTTNLTVTMAGSVTNTSGVTQTIRVNGRFTVPYFGQTSPTTMIAGSTFRYSTSPL